VDVAELQSAWRDILKRAKLVQSHCRAGASWSSRPCSSPRRAPRCWS
jgi:hypothetical protein